MEKCAFIYAYEELQLFIRQYIVTFKPTVFILN